jgi:sulfite reductase (NADPH) flavoprotein alpha-component
MRSSLVPSTAPFGPDEIASLDSVLSPASPTQRAWLSGFLAGLDAQARPAAALVAEAPRKAEPLTILFASESGNSERLAGDAAKAAKKLGFKPKIVDFADWEASSFAGLRNLLVVAATWGEGEPPGRAARGYKAFMEDASLRLDGVSFGVLALGDSAYVEFCAIGKAIDARLEALGGRRAANRVDLDLDFEEGAARWIESALGALAPKDAAPDNIVAVDFARGATSPATGPITAEVSEHVNLNSSRSAKQTIHLALGFEGSAPAYEPGDALEIFGENDPALVDEVLAAASLKADDALRISLSRERDITTLSPVTIERFVGATGHAGAKALLDGGEARAWIEGRQLVDLLDAFPTTLDAAQLAAITRPLPPRAYSIASSRKEVGDDEAHLLVAAVRYESHGRSRSGVASTHVADRLKAGASIRTKLRANRHFRLPADPAADIVMVGPGTGIAPFRAFVQERRAVGATGRSWLFYGDRHFTHDFLYQTEWQEALKEGSLTRLDLAFSRDQPEKIYVQDRLYERRRDLVDWIEGGASLYVCGDAKAMAKDVRAAVTRAYAEVKALSDEAAEAAIADLERAGRYLQDVY